MNHDSPHNVVEATKVTMLGYCVYKYSMCSQDSMKNL